MNCCAGHDACQPTIAGVYRCYFTTGDDCLPNVAPQDCDPGIPGDCPCEFDPGDPDRQCLCSFNEECCCGLCTAATEGGTDLVCCPGGITCKDDGEHCLSDADCCSGNCLETGMCGPDDTSCLPMGWACVDDADCCSGNCPVDIPYCAPAP